MPSPEVPRIVLASTSPYRRQLLERLGISFEQIAPACDEEALKDPSFSPQALAEHLATAKATSLAANHSDAIIIGSDQLAHCNGHIMGKPGTADAAVAQLEQLSGRTHHLITAVCVCANGDEHHFCDITALTMRKLDRSALSRYVDADQPLDCAGAYKLEARGITLFERIESADHSAITGLPLIALTTLLRHLGCTIP